ncbi:MAG: Gfo/Idh/MocA family oxidoreductase [Verrucomicrobiae bacterium]|nr:Gfo/Idh/MocA family oxidoreductase [Verrucomicrobiae bacterium]
MKNKLRIGIIGLDTSHVEAFTSLLNSAQHPWHIEGGEVVAAFPGGSPDFQLSHSRVQGFTDKLRDQFKVKIVDSPEAVARECDAILLESVDGRVHLEQFKRIASSGKPVFVDKPFAVTSSDARAILSLASQHRIPLMSCSALRYAASLVDVLENRTGGEVIGADFYGPMAIEPTQPGFFWYGIHTAEMLYAAMGRGCVEVAVTTHADHDLVVGVWKDGRMGTIRGNRAGNGKFGGMVHRKSESQFVDVYSNPKPYYASLMEKILALFSTGQASVDPEETFEVIRFLEAANQSRETGSKVKL